MNINLKRYSSSINDFKDFGSFYDYNEYYLLKNNNIYKFVIYINNNEIIIATNNYNIIIDLISLSKLFRLKFNTIFKAYEFLINKFDDNEIFIHDIINKDNLKLSISKDNIIIILNYNKQKKDYIINIVNKLEKEIKELNNQVNTLFIENNILKNEINCLKFAPKKDVRNIKLLSNISNDSFADFDLDKTFIIFKSIENISYLIYSSQKDKIISYNLDKEQKNCEIRTNHKDYISNFRHYLDKIKMRDLIISISAKNNYIKLWNIKNWECILNIKNVNKFGYLDSACFLFDGYNNYIITSNSNKNNISEKIKIYDFKGTLIKSINQSNEQTYFIDVYYDSENNEIYIITGSENCLRAFNYSKNELYQKYFENNNGAHICIVMLKNKKQLNLIESCDDGNIRIWDFHSANLLKKIKVSSKFLFGICLWDIHYILVGCEDKTIKLIEINKGIIVKTLNGHNDDVLSLDKITLPKYGECLISQGRKNDQIIIWLKDG